MGWGDEGETLLSKAMIEAADFSKVSSEAFAQQAHAFRWDTIPNLAGRVAYALTPSLIRNWISNDQKTISASKEPRSTAWMDGLRGITALIVFNKHYLFAFTDMTVMPWGANKHHHYLIELPIIRLVYSGSSALNFFFAVAGYVVSIKSLQLASAPNGQSKLFPNLASSAFRGMFRLFLTVAAITLIWSILAYLNAFEPMRPYIEDERLTYFPGMWAEGNVRRLPTFKLQLALWWHEMRRLTNVFALKNAYSELDPHLWTTILQFRAQMHIYFVLLVTARMRDYVRLTFFWGFLFLYLTWDRWEIALYMAGVIIAQLHVWRDKKNSLSHQLPQTEKEVVTEFMDQSAAPPLHPPSSISANSRSSLANTARPRLAPLLPALPIRLHPRSRLSRALRSLLNAIAFTTCLYLLSYANLSYKYPSPGFEFLNPWIPSWFSWRSKFWPAVGTCFMLYLLTKTDTYSPWQKVMNHWWPQYLGKVMFAMVRFSPFRMPDICPAYLALDAPFPVPPHLVSFSIQSPTLALSSNNPPCVLVPRPRQCDAHLRLLDPAHVLVPLRRARHSLWLDGRIERGLGVQSNSRALGRGRLC